MRPWLPLLLLCVSVSPGWAAEPDAFPDLNIHNAGAVREASRVLEEELKLAARPQTYVVIDLAPGAISIKGRGVQLHRMMISRWSAVRAHRHDRNLSHARPTPSDAAKGRSRHRG